MKKKSRYENISEIIGKISELKGLKTEQDIAAVLGISKTNFSNRKKRGTLIPLIMDWAVHEKIDVQWLLGCTETDAPRRNIIINGGNGSVQANTVNAGHINISMNNDSQASLGEGVNLLERIKQAKNKTLYAIAIEQLKGLANMAEKE